MKKRFKYAVFAGDPEEGDLGGWGDFQAAFATLPAAISYVRMTIPQHEGGWWWEVVNLEQLSISVSSTEIAFTTTH